MRVSGLGEMMLAQLLSHHLASSLNSRPRLARVHFARVPASPEFLKAGPSLKEVRAPLEPKTPFSKADSSVSWGFVL